MEQPEISEQLFKLLNGEQLENKQHEAMMLLSVTEDHWPHTAMISVGEIIALSRTKLRLAMWPNTTTTGNLIRTEKATLVLFYEGIAHYVRLSLRRLPLLADSLHTRERFEAEVVSAREDVAKYADITSGVQVQLKDNEAVIQRWNETLAELKM
ncbi:hypothetical protein [Paenibacillus pini]|uniref:Pyridoxamine 5'-phosphate oxidase putative domain-containing protein n=1 Tax=Paenibacillus pini JCM 16418 TaxID=1236976 RepID=W7Z641_9BACL|nr:hypothetical protein [Paenibacillus pini]GAF09789.1 hypothetical protein JCM16418_3945 [Paenibacillus pini JCM 16418]